MSDGKSFEQVTAQLREFASTLTARQRLLLAGGAVLVAVVLFTFVRLLSKPEMATLYSNMEPQDAQSLAQHLSTKNIRFQLSPDGRSVLVSSDQLDTARLETAASGAAHSGRMGFELFDKANWATSDFDDRVNYQRALEGELERTIQAMGGVLGARVHLVMPADSIYSAQDRQAKAAVILKLKDHRIPLAMRQSVQRLVAAAVDKLDPQAVTVVDADSGESAREAEAKPTSEEELMTERLLRTLEPVTGPDHIRATVHAEFDQASLEENSETYDPDQTVALTMQRSEETNGAPPAGGAPGTASNVPGGGTPAKTAESFSQSKSENGTYAVNKVVRHVTQPAGRLKKLAVAVLVDDLLTPANKANPRQKRSAQDLKSIEELAKASVGFDAARGDVLTVQNISFQTLSIDPPPPPTRVQKIRNTLQEWNSLVRIGGMLLMFLMTYFLVIHPVKKQLLRSFTRAAGEKSAAGGHEGAPVLPPGAAAALQSAAGADDSDSQQVNKLKGDIGERVRDEPYSASKLVQGWIREGARS